MIGINICHEHPRRGAQHPSFRSQTTRRCMLFPCCHLCSLLPAIICVLFLWSSASFSCSLGVHCRSNRQDRGHQRSAGQLDARREGATGGLANPQAFSGRGINACRQLHSVKFVTDVSAYVVAITQSQTFKLGARARCPWAAVDFSGLTHYCIVDGDFLIVNLSSSIKQQLRPLASVRPTGAPSRDGLPKLGI